MHFVRVRIREWMDCLCVQFTDCSFPSAQVKTHESLAFDEVMLIIADHCCGHNNQQ